MQAVFAAAVGEDGVFEGEFAEDGDWGEEAEGWLRVSKNLWMMVVEG